jgi:ribosome biogenesis GTPase A
MSIQWYPGHMVKAKKALALAIPKQDVVVEVLDARAPRASGNPVVTELRAHKPCVKVLAKSDLADDAVTRAWLAHFEADAGNGGGGKVLAMAATTDRGGETKARVLALVRRLVTRTIDADGKGRSVKVIVVGVPNVGKSTLINTLAGRRVAKVGDEPAVTKSTQQVVLDGNIVLCDNPGILWPKLEDQSAALRLALMGSIPDTAIDFESVAHFGAALFLRDHGAAVMKRYDLTTLPGSPTELLHAVGKRRGCIRAGGVIDVHKAADHLIHDYRAGLLGRITLEAP